MGKWWVVAGLLAVLGWLYWQLRDPGYVFHDDAGVEYHMPTGWPFINRNTRSMTRRTPRDGGMI